MIKEIAFTAYPARDVAALQTFYHDVLGLNFGEPYSEEGVPKYVEANVGTGCFGIMTHEWLDMAPGSSGGVAFEVDDIEKTRDELHGRGVKTEKIYDTPVCRLLSLRDPEGNKVTLHQLTVPH